MSSKKKLIISLSVAAAVLVAAIIAIVAVFAASAQTVTSTITISFKAGADIQGSVVATYSDEAGTNKGNIGEWSFLASDDEQSYNLETTEVVIALEGSANDFVEFTYVFTNSGANHMAIVPTVTAPGYNVTYSVEAGTYVDTCPSIILAGVASGADANEVTVTVKLAVPDARYDIAAKDITLSWAMDSSTETPTYPVAG